ncbi:MAG: hypothetical protein HUK22_05035, partial [Thermoguttaceae bacterium]|nr:hypothetical protein [Thermoguttaceae bacterium]
NVVRLGPIDMPVVSARGARNWKSAPPAKECAKCNAIVAAGYAACPECGELFPAKRKKDGLVNELSSADVIDQGATLEYDVDSVCYSEHLKKDAEEGAPRTLRVDYEIAPGRFVSQWLCPEHTGWTRRKFEDWWRLRSKTQPPKTAKDAAELANAGALAKPKRILSDRKPGKKFAEIQWLEATDIPEFDAASYARLREQFSCFDEFNDFAEPENEFVATPQAEPQSTGANDGFTCSTCLCWSSDLCTQFNKERSGGAPACDDYVDASDIPF